MKGMYRNGLRYEYGWYGTSKGVKKIAITTLSPKTASPYTIAKNAWFIINENYQTGEFTATLQINHTTVWEATKPSLASAKNALYKACKQHNVILDE